jgi:hypothetical protein
VVVHTCKEDHEFEASVVMLVVDTLSQKQQQKKIGKVSETLSQKQKNYKHKGCGFGSDGGVLASYAQGLNSIPNITKNYFFLK